MRIVGGKYRHRLIAQPKTILTRPTTDRVREALMSILGNEIIDAVVLDLFSGSGAFGIEALSRGAKEVYFNDHNLEAIKTIKKNLKDLNVNESYEIYFLDYLTLLNQLLLKGKKFSIVFLDPPYKREDYYRNSVDKILQGLLLENGIIVIESNNEYDDERFNIKQYRYGTIYLNILRRK